MLLGSKIICSLAFVIWNNNNKENLLSPTVMYVWCTISNVIVLFHTIDYLHTLQRCIFFLPFIQKYLNIPNLVGLSSFPLSVILPSECVGVEKNGDGHDSSLCTQYQDTLFCVTRVIVLATERKCVTTGLNLNVWLVENYIGIILDTCHNLKGSQ